MIDLHAHTTVSDGTLSPKELIRLAKKTGLSAIAITDHDSIEGHEEAAKEAGKLGIRLIKGIEFDAYYKGRRLHILGLNIDGDHPDFLKIYQSYRKGKEKLLGPVFEGLEQLGAHISLEDAKVFQSGDYLDRQALAKCLVDKGYTTIMKESWINYLDKIPHQEGELLDIQSVLDAIHYGGGKAFMAHFHLPIGLAGLSDEGARQFLSELKEMGLDGLEYYYPSFTKEDRLKVADYIQDFGFLKSGGSDFHGANRAHIQLGIGQGNFKVPDQVLENIIPKSKENASA